MFHKDATKDYIMDRCSMNNISDDDKDETKENIKSKRKKVKYMGKKVKK